MLSTKALGVYLNDHLAGSVAGVSLIEQSRDHNKGTPLGAFLDGLLDEVRADQQALEGLMEQLGIDKSQIKQAGTWLVEKFTRLKFMTSGGTGEGLRNLLELEALRLGVQGKHALWLALEEVADLDPRLAGADVKTLRARAELQIEGIEEHRLEAARGAFLDSDPGH
jgi:hypothetical protein